MSTDERSERPRKVITGAAAADVLESRGSNPSGNPTLDQVLEERLSRRGFLVSGLAAGAFSLSGGSMPTTTPAAAENAAVAPLQPAAGSFDFPELAVTTDETHHVAAGYDAQVLIRWGEPMLPGTPDFDPEGQTAEAQARQFGYNNDFLGFLPIDGKSDHGLLVVNHEYTNEELMFPPAGWFGWVGSLFADTPKAQVDIEMMAHGGSVLEVKRTDGVWDVVKGSKYARRITAETEMRISGPAAGHVRMQTSADPSGTKVLGMLNNCAGGITPWGTWLTCEENINYYFSGKDAAERHPDARAYRRYGLPAEIQAWGQHHDRFDVAKEPNEPNRFGWVVEIDPLDPASMPVKRTAMGRFKHEGAGNIINGDGRFVVYQGDDEMFDYVYRFVTAGKVDFADPKANRDLLDDGVLSVARFKADGTGEWIPLVHGQGAGWLTEKFGFRDQGDVVIHARLSADLVGATKMDRPEDVEVSPKSGKVYVLLTMNASRKDTGDKGVDPANPRPANRYGHIIEIMPDGGDHAAPAFRWDILVKCGDPTRPEVGATFNPAVSSSGWFGMPDNCVFDAEGRLWVSTDGNKQNTTGRHDGLWAMGTEGAERGLSRCFYQVPRGAELCGPCFTPDMETLFVAVQHPAENREVSPANPLSTYTSPSTRWPDFLATMPPRPSIVAITRQGGGKIAV
ncbi:MAG: PhoX family protein [Hyphomicrobium sp.]